MDGINSSSTGGLGGPEEDENAAGHDPKNAGILASTDDQEGANENDETSKHRKL